MKGSSDISVAMCKRMLEVTTSYIWINRSAITKVKTSQFEMEAMPKGPKLVWKASVYIDSTNDARDTCPASALLHRVIKSANPEHHGKCSLFGSSDDR